MDILAHGAQRGELDAELLEVFREARVYERGQSTG
jgi:hypothetical protein